MISPQHRPQPAAIPAYNSSYIDIADFFEANIEEELTSIADANCALRTRRGYGTVRVIDALYIDISGSDNIPCLESAPRGQHRCRPHRLHFRLVGGFL